MEFSGIYKISRSGSATGQTIIQIKASASKPFKIIRAWVTQSDTTSSSQTAIQLVRKSAAATVSTAVISNLVQLRPGDMPSNVALGVNATGFTATVEGTDDPAGLLIEEGFNILNGWLYLPVPEERIIVPANGIIALKFPVTPPSATYKAGIIFGELG